MMFTRFLKNLRAPGLLAAMLACGGLTMSGEARAVDFSGQWQCSYVSFDANSNNRIERAYTLWLYPNGGYEAQGTYSSSLIGRYERWISRGEWRIGGQGDNNPYVQAGGPAQFNSGRGEQFIFWGWIRSANLLESQYSNQGYQNQTSCAR